MWRRHRGVRAVKVAGRFGFICRGSWPPRYCSSHIPCSLCPRCSSKERPCFARQACAQARKRRAFGPHHRVRGCHDGYCRAGCDSSPRRTAVTALSAFTAGPAPLPPVALPTVPSPPAEDAAPRVVADALDTIFAATTTRAGCISVSSAWASLLACLDAQPAATTAALWARNNVLLSLTTVATVHTGCACADGANAPLQVLAALLSGLSGSEVVAKLAVFEPLAAAAVTTLTSSPLPDTVLATQSLASLSTVVAAHPSVAAACPSVAAAPACLVSALPHLASCAQVAAAGIATLTAFVKHLPAAALSEHPYVNTAARGSAPLSPAVAQVAAVGRSCISSRPVAAAAAAFLAACCSNGATALHKAVFEVGVELLADSLRLWPGAPEVVHPACDVFLAVYRTDALPPSRRSVVLASSAAAGAAAALSASNPCDGALLQKILASLVAIERFKPGAFDAYAQEYSAVLAPALLGAMWTFHETRPMLAYWGSCLLGKAVETWSTYCLQSADRLFLAMTWALLAWCSDGGVTAAAPGHRCASDTDPTQKSWLAHLRVPLAHFKTLIRRRVLNELHVDGVDCRPAQTVLQVSLTELGDAMAGVVRAAMAQPGNSETAGNALNVISELAASGPPASRPFLFSCSFLATVAAAVRAPGLTLRIRRLCVSLLRDTASEEPDAFGSAPGLGWAAALDAAVYALLHLPADAQPDEIVFNVPLDSLKKLAGAPLLFAAMLMQRAAPAPGEEPVVAALQPQPVVEAILAALPAVRGPLALAAAAQ